MEIGDGLSVSCSSSSSSSTSSSFSSSSFAHVSPVRAATQRRRRRQQQQQQQRRRNPPPLSVSLPVPPSSPRRSSIRVSRSENSSVLVGAPNEPEIRSEPRVSNGRYGAQLTLKYHRCGSVRDGIRHGARLRWGFQGERGIWARDKGPKDRPILWTPKLADPRSPIRANYPSRSYSLRGNVHPGNELPLFLPSILFTSSTSRVATTRNSARI